MGAKRFKDSYEMVKVRGEKLSLHDKIEHIKKNAFLS